MSNKLDLHSQFTFTKCVSPVDGGGNTLITGDTIDLAGYDGVEFVVMTGILADTDATFPVTLYEDSDSAMGSETAVTDAGSLYGTVPSMTFADDSTTFAFGYRGSKRYVRVKIAPAANSGSDPLAVLAILRKKKVGSTL